MLKILLLTVAVVVSNHLYAQEIENEAQAQSQTSTQEESVAAEPAKAASPPPEVESKAKPAHEPPAAPASVEERTLEEEVIVRPKKKRVRVIEVEEEEPSEKVLKEPSRFKIGISLYYSLADSVKSSGSVSVQGSQLTFNGKEEAESAFGIGLSLLQRLSRSFGLEYGVAHEMNRTMDSYSYTINGGHVSGNYSGSRPEVKLLIGFINGRYFANEDVYLMGGLNITHIDMSSTEMSIGTGYGGQVGLGFVVNEKVTFEAQYRMIVSKASTLLEFNGVQATMDITRIELSGLNLLFKYQF